MKAVPIGEVTKPVRTWNPTREPEREFSYVDLSAVDNVHKLVVAPVTVTGQEAPSRARQIVRTDDVLVSTVRPNLNAVALIGRELDGATASTGFTVLRPANQLDPRYLFHWVRTPKFVADMVRKATGASYPAVSDRIVKESVIPLPPLDEQRRIAAILDYADEIRDQLRNQRDAVVKLRSSIFSEMFGTTQPTTTLGDCGEVQGGLQVSAKRAGLPVELPYLRVANVYRDRLDLTDVKTIRTTEAEAARTRLEVGDLLFVEGHANPNEVGRAAVWDGSIQNCVHQNHLIRVRLDTSKLLPDFSVAWFNSPSGASHFRRAGKTTSGLNTISASQVRSAPTPIPSLACQREFSRRCQELSRLTGLCDYAVTLADGLCLSTQSRAFAGQA